jgi:hypothetical protein
MAKRVEHPNSNNKHLDLAHRYKELGIGAVAAAVQCKGSSKRARAEPRRDHETRPAATGRSGAASGSRKSK